MLLFRNILFFVFSFNNLFFSNVETQEIVQESINESIIDNQTLDSIKKTSFEQNIDFNKNNILNIINNETTNTTEPYEKTEDPINDFKEIPKTNKEELIMFSSKPEGPLYNRKINAEKKVCAILIDKVGVDNYNIARDLITSKEKTTEISKNFFEQVKDTNKSVTSFTEEFNLLNKDSECVSIILKFFRDQHDYPLSIARFFLHCNQWFLNPLSNFFSKTNIKYNKNNSEVFFCKIWVFQNNLKNIKQEQYKNYYKKTMNPNELLLFLNKIEENNKILVDGVKTIVDEDWDLSQMFGIKRDLIDSSGNVSLVINKDYIVVFKIINKFNFDIGKKNIKARVFVFKINKNKEELISIIHNVREDKDSNGNKKTFGDYFDFVQNFIEQGFVLKSVHDEVVKFDNENDFIYKSIYYNSDNEKKKEITFFTPISWERKRNYRKLFKKSKKNDEIVNNLYKKTNMMSNIHISSLPKNESIIKKISISGFKQLTSFFK